MGTENFYSTPRWREIRQLVLKRDGFRCRDCNRMCESPDADVHHLIPRSTGGKDEPGNLVTLCDGCHAVHHPNLQATLSRRFIERWACRLAKWLDGGRLLSDGFDWLGSILRLFAIRSFRESQLDVVLAALQGRSILFISPTGSGKSLCFQAPALLRAGTTFVISPLKALMSDQIAHLQHRKVPGTFINSDLGSAEKQARYEMIDQGMFKFIYCAPERFDQDTVSPIEIQRLLAVKPNYLVVDEAHCIVRWGHDFRRSYGQLGQVRLRMGNPPVLAFTATAGRKTQDEIVRSLRMENPKIVVAGVDRPNIVLMRLRTEGDSEKIRSISRLLHFQHGGKTMLFVPTLKVGEFVQSELARISPENVIPFYHSQLSTARKEELLGKFTGRTDPTISGIICTNAFGMGLDVPNVRLVIHWQPPDSAESYLQEFGRAGRDGKPSLAVLFYDTANGYPKTDLKRRENSDDAKLLRFMAEKTINSIEMSSEDKEVALASKYDVIDEMFEMATPGRACFREKLLNYFRDPADKKPRGFVIWLVSRLFSSRTRQPKMSMCCDYCDRVTAQNLLDTLHRKLKWDVIKG
jgi:ATP-dependent DNA helicase RecQ